MMIERQTRVSYPAVILAMYNDIRWGSSILPADFGARSTKTASLDSVSAALIIEAWGHMRCIRAA